MATTKVSTIPISPVYSEHFDEDGIAYYCNHATRTTSWLHPAKFRALQDGGIVPTAPGSTNNIAGLDAPDYPVPAPWERRRDEHGLVYYANSETKAKQYRHPDLLEQYARRFSDCEAVYFTPGDSTMKAESRYTAKCALPPWVLEEMTVPPAGSGLKPKPYWVNYRTDRRDPFRSPLDWFEARLKAAAKAQLKAAAKAQAKM